MGFFSNIIPNELKGGGWVDYAGTAVGLATGNPLLGAAVGAGGAAYRGGNPILGGLQGYGAGNAGASLFGEGGLYGWATGPSDPGFGPESMYRPGTTQSLYDAASGVPFPGGSGGATFGDGTPSWGSLYDNAMGGATTSGGFNPIGTPPINPSGGEEGSLWEQLRRRVLGAKTPGALGVGTSALNLGSGLYGLYTAAQTRKLAAPGRAAADQLRMLTENPGAIRSYPGYVSGLDAGRQELERSLAKQGQIGGGMAAEAMAKFGGAYDMQYRNAELQRLAQVTQGAVPAEAQANEIVRRALNQIAATFRRA